MPLCVFVQCRRRIEELGIRTPGERTQEKLLTICCRSKLSLTRISIYLTGNAFVTRVVAMRRRQDD